LALDFRQPQGSFFSVNISYDVNRYGFGGNFYFNDDDCFALAPKKSINEDFDSFVLKINKT